MATTTSVDPTTIPTVAPKAPKTVVLSGAPTPIPNKRARKRVTKADIQMVRKITGYDESSPIWGKRLSEVLVSIETHISTGIGELQAGSYANADVALSTALLYNQELQRRIATNSLIASQRK